MSPPLARISAAVTASQRDELEHLGGPDGGISAGARMAIAAGLSALRAGDPAATAGLLPDELNALADRLARVIGRRTGAGAFWCPTPEAVPAPDVLAAGNVVLAVPEGVMLATPDTALSFDLSQEEILLSGNGREVCLPGFGLVALGQVSMVMPSAVYSLPNGCRMLPGGLRMTLSPDGSEVEFAAGGLAARVSLQTAWILSAELLSLFARARGRSEQIRVALESRLAEVAS